MATAVAEIDDLTPIDKAWKSERNILTPDVESQDFMGDIMTSNTYMTMRIPANWKDTE